MFCLNAMAEFTDLQSLYDPIFKDNFYRDFYILFSFLF